MKRGIVTEQFAVGYGKKTMIDDISISVEPGKILTLIGPNGSGKSTILKSITRQLKPLGGAVYLDEKSMNTMKEAEIAKHMSMVMTERIKPELMSCRDVVATGRYPYTGKLGILTKEDWMVVNEAMAIVRADEVAKQDFLKISDGQKQRVMLARAICQSTQILVLDEPTSYLDMRYKLDILMNIRRMTREKNLAVIMSLHELDLAQKISDTIACVDGNKISRVGTPEEIFYGNFIQKLYGVAEKSFDVKLGIMHLEANHGQPKVFVISGAGTGICVFYRLQRANIPFAVGILGENDMDYGVAKAVAAKVISAKAFYHINEEQVQEAKDVMDICDNCICTLDSFGPLNKENEMLMDYANECGKLIDIEILFSTI